MNPFSILGVATLAVASFCTPVLADQSCRDNIQASTPDGRFADNGDGTVLDHATGLMWQRCAEGLSGEECTEGQATEVWVWSGALQHAEASRFAGYEGWRLPNVKELESIVERRCFDPAINANVFPNLPTDFRGMYFFWTSSPKAYDRMGASRISFYDGMVDYELYSGIATFIRLVRDTP